MNTVKHENTNVLASVEPESAAIVYPAPNPQFTSPEVVAGFTPEQMALTFRAYESLHDDDKKYQFYEQAGIDAVTEGFKGLRRLNGEETYGGLEFSYVDTDQRTSMDDYFQLMSQGKLTFSDWIGHDKANHMSGALLATGDTTELLKASASVARDLSPSHQTVIADYIDESTYFIDEIRRSRFSGKVEAERLKGQFNALAREARLQEAYPPEKISQMVDAQKDFIKELCRKKFFVLPERDLATMAIGHAA